MVLFLVLVARYGVMSGLAYVVFFKWKPRFFAHRRIQEKPPAKKRMRAEFFYSISSLAIFGMSGIAIGFLNYLGYTQMYFEIAEYGWGYFVLSFFILILAHDTYFYWSHRFMHLKPIYKRVHRIHHLSTNPSPWAAFSFHPLEAIIETGIVPIMVFAMPLHPIILLVFATYSLALNIMGHLGYEIFPRGFTKGIFWWHNTSTHHNLHHQKFNCNYSLYFNWWDRIMGTNISTYHEEFDRITSRPKQKKEKKELVPALNT